jgi:hypothetical protein
MRKFHLAYDPFGAGASKIGVFIRVNRDIEHWYQPFAGSFLFKSEKNIYEIQAVFTEFFGVELFMVTDNMSAITGGMLPQPIWDWYNEGTLTGLLG